MDLRWRQVFLCLGTLVGMLLIGCGGSAGSSPTPTLPSDPATTYVLSANSINPGSGVSITVTPADNSNAANGSTGFTRTYNSGTTVTLTAPTTSGSNTFTSWTGCTTTSTVTCTIKMTANTTVTANYAPSNETYKTLRSGGQHHNLLIGTAADSGYLTETLYASTLSTEYSQLEAENEMKFGLIHPQQTTYAWTGPDALVAFAQANSMMVRGHNLVWSQQVPTWVTNPTTAWTPTTLNQVLSDHIATVVGHYKGQIYAWDVVNEPFNSDGTIASDLWYDTPGIGFAGQRTKYIEQSLKWAHAADSTAVLFVNDYGVETVNTKSNAMYAMAQDFVNRGVPLGGVGLEFHIDPSFDTNANLTSLSENIQRFGALGLQVHITELDVRLPDDTTASLTAQAQTYQDILNVCLSQPACTSFQTWGFTDEHSWIPSFVPGYGWALPFDLTYGKKAAYNSLLQSLQ